MKVLVTGASGFLGRAVIRSALDAGHQPIALSRPSTDVGRFGWPDQVRIVQGDLLEPGDWMEALRDAEAVIHAAAVVSGSAARQFEGAVDTTRNLLDVLDPTALRRFVHVSSFSVYDFTKLRPGAVLTEEAPVEERPIERDGYTIAKLEQEKMVRGRCEALGISYLILRPGAIFGPGRDWNFGRAFRFGPFDVIFSPSASFRLTYVDNCADALIAALSAPTPSDSIINIVDDDLPDHGVYNRLSRRSGAKTGLPIAIPWPLLSAGGRIAGMLSRALLPGGRRLPELLEPRRQEARWKPLRYSNDRAHRLLNWTPRIDMLEAIKRTVAGAGH